ncbi:hypothetical protein H8E88_25945 [candidate division KSB1 bacterium]|nr:hypothetical protein [candidate division KSB1 bacterium]
MSKIIIGIHGLGNKPPAKILEKWWKNSIREGLSAFGYKKYFFKFKLVYWADILHPDPLNPNLKDKENPIYLHEPYVRAENYERQAPSHLKRKILDYIEKQLDSLFLNDDMSINFTNVTDLIVRHFFTDLDIYYSNKRIQQDNSSFFVRVIIRDKLAGVLKKYLKKEILLIGHSMGSIIAYDVLTQTAPDVQVDTLVTPGSPLGLAIIVNRIKMEQNKKISKLSQLCTPENVTRHWFNLSDLRDKVTLNYNLSDDYDKNKKKIKPVDKIVYNNYKYNDEENPHKSYGYLRTPEMAEIINTFLTRGNSKIRLWIEDKIERIFSKKFKRQSNDSPKI